MRRVRVRYAIGGIAAAALIALPASASASHGGNGGGQVNGLAAQQCAQEKANIGTDSVQSAMDECVAEDVDQILNPDDYVDDTGDDGSDG